ncbi:hypothetical protein [uncultured Eubacterium sp.]|nr:hypothetical protein [uncultured Eubacterium sp.]
MKRAMIIYLIIFLATLLIPMLSMIKPAEPNDTSELVTLFNSASVLLFN